MSWRARWKWMQLTDEGRLVEVEARWSRSPIWESFDTEEEALERVTGDDIEERLPSELVLIRVFERVAR